MLNGILEANARPIMSVISKFNYVAAGALIGRKVFQVTAYSTYKMGGSVAGWLGKQNVAEWNKASNEYWALVKKDTVRDLTLAVKFVVLGLAFEQADSFLDFAKEKLVSANGQLDGAIKKLDGASEHLTAAETLNPLLNWLQVLSPILLIHVMLRLGMNYVK